MKASKLVLTLLITASLTTFAENMNDSVPSKNVSVVEANLLHGLNSDNKGLSVSSAYYLGELKSESAVIPLMRQLRSSDNEDLRIASALSLAKIGDERGLFLLKRMAKFESNDKVKEFCSKFYHNTKSK